MFITRNPIDAILRYRPDDPPAAADPAVTPPVTPATATEPPTGLAALIAKNDNSALKVAEMLHGDNYQLREKNRQLQAQIDGAVILRDEDKKAWQAYKALGAPAELATKLRQGELERVAGKAGFVPQVFADLDRMAGGRLTYESKLETVEGVQVERVYVKDTATPDVAPQLLSEYAKSQWAAYLPSLTPVAAGGQSTQGVPAATAPGVRFPAQHPGGGGQTAPNDIVAKFQQEQAEAAKAVKNPLLKS